MKKSLLLFCALTLSAASFAAADPIIVIVPKNGDTTSVLKALRAKGVKVAPNFSCPSTATLIKVTPVKGKNQALISCLSPNKTRPKAISMKSRQNAQGIGNEIENDLENDSLNELEGGAASTGGDPNSVLTEMEGGAQGDPNELEGSATGSGKASSLSVGRFLGKVEKAAKSAQAQMHKILVD